MAAKQSFQGWMGLSADATKGKMEWGTFEPKPWEETDVDIAISHCGICGSDLHTLRSGWGATPYPVCVGHEIVGTAIRVGSSVSHIKVGDRVGVGAQSDACLNRPGLVPEAHPIPSEDCFECSQGAPNACPRMVNTYASTHYNGGKGWGGYATHHRAPGAFVVRIPDGIESKDAAPMLCGGVTVYSPLKRHGAGPGKRVGIIGLGGLGHFGILFAKALGADKVVAISRRKSKEADALALGADYYIATAEEENWAVKHRNSLDLIVSTVSSAKMPLTEYLGLLRLDGVLVQVGAPEEGPLPVNAFSLMMSRRSVAGSVIGSPKEIEEMLALAVQKEIRPWVEERKMTEANKAVVDMEKGDARYRYVLVNEKAGVSGVKAAI